MKIYNYPIHDILYNPIGENRKSIVESARLCYKSVGKSAEADSKLITRLVSSDPPHWSPIEMGELKVRFICDRGLSHELVRHRLASFNQESTRYCNYSKDKFGKEIAVVKPYEIKVDSPEYDIWRNQCEEAEKAYMELLDAGVTPESARSVLPTCLATTIDIKTNLREWYHICDLRTARGAHPDMRIMMHGLLIDLGHCYPEIFEELFWERNTQIVNDFAKKGNN